MQQQVLDGRSIELDRPIKYANNMQMNCNFLFEKMSETLNKDFCSRTPVTMERANE
jgi:hypothetical protein